MALKLPHPIPYQGSKRSLAPLIKPYIPSGIDRFYEPFSGSAAMTIFAAHYKLANRFVIADALEPIIDLLKCIVEDPTRTADRYREIWSHDRTSEVEYFNYVRARYNSDRSPIDLLYLICRCVKNAVRFNSKGAFTQSVDKRRLGMNPIKMEQAIKGVSFLLKDKAEFRTGDWIETTSDATDADFIYMDPPYLGTTIGKDKRYFQQLTSDRLIAGLENFNSRSIKFALSYDGMTGEKEYGPPLPDYLGMTRLLLHAGTSSQATLSGRKEQTLESLYLSSGIASTEKSDTIIGQKFLNPALF